MSEEEKPVATIDCEGMTPEEIIIAFLEICQEHGIDPNYAPVEIETEEGSEKFISMLDLIQHYETEETLEGYNDEA